jgi:NAD(P)-dependent dehydrogenase (short-subunit alcohol dehydrogenase family)/acyl carrier protein
MANYQQVMQRFLETERAVMLAYLGAPRPAERPPQPARRAIAMPAAAGNGSPPPAPGPDTGTNGIAPAVAPAAAPAPAPAAAPAAPGDVKAKLLAVVSERTGYPVEMLDLDADMEADLGIDSIKRVEIAGTMIQDLPAGETDLDLEQITATRTLREVIDALEGGASGTGAVAAATGSPAESPRPFEDRPADGRIDRFVLRTAGAPAVDERAGLARDGVVAIVDDATGVGAALAARLERLGERSVLLPAADLGGADAAACLRRALEDGGHGPVKALVHLGALAAEPAGVTSLFLLAQAAREDLEAAAGGGGAVVLAATAMGGAFAVEDALPGLDPSAGAVAGLLKTLAREWPDVRVKAVDLGPAEAASAAAWLEDELFAADGIVEVGYLDGRRTVPELVPAPTAGRDGDAPLGEDSVVLVTGGARGITAEVAVALAERHRPVLVLVGRTDPVEEDPATAALRDEPELKRAIFERRRAAGSEVTPAAVDAEYRAIAGAREVRENLARIRRTGARVQYRSCDVRDGDALAALVASVYDEHGRIDGVIHGAGVVEDKLVRDKALASFERVLAAKAGSARALAAALRPDSLRFVVFFGSVSGRFGNRGQADYAAASEVLNKLAQDLDRRWDARVVTINWGPWLAGGMVSPGVRRQFEDRGVSLIGVDAGTRCLEEELRLGRKGEVEVVIGGFREPEAGPLTPLLRSGGAVTRRSAGGAEVVRTLDPAQDAYLDDHRLDGTPVLPFAVAMELMAATAAAARPDLQVTGLRGIRLLRGITVDGAATRIRVAAVPDGATAMDVVVEGVDGDRRPHFNAAVELGERLPAAGPQPEPLTGLPAFPMPVDEAYAAYLFHGPLFQGITAIEGMDERGARATLRPSDPGDCLRGLPAGGGWLLDPVLLDCAFQLQVLWARVHWDVTPLPALLARYDRFAAPPSSGRPVRHELRMQTANRSPMCVADHSFRADDGTLLATLTAVQAVGTRALNRLAGASA